MVHHRPHGLAALPRRPGYLYVMRHTITEPMRLLRLIILGTSKNPIPSTDTAPANATITR